MLNEGDEEDGQGGLLEDEEEPQEEHDEPALTQQGENATVTEGPAWILAL